MQAARGNDDNEREDAPSSDEEGIDLMNSEGDSSEEEEEDPEEEARIRDGFIADDDDDDASRERKRRRRKKRKQREREFEALSEDDLDLVEQNTGVRIERPEGRKLKKLKRAGAASDNEDDQDEEDRIPDIANLFDDIGARARKDKGKKRAAADDLPDAMDEDDMADFIEEDSPDEGEDRDKEARQARKMKEKERRRKRATGLAMGGLDIGAEAWDEIQEIFGDGHDYDDALESDEEEGGKPTKQIRDVFEPSEIAERMMTDADDIIRGLDIPERMQIAQFGLATRTPPPPADLPEGQAAPEAEASDTLLFQDELPGAANWIAERISPTLTSTFIVTPTGEVPPLRDHFIAAVQQVLQFLCVDYFEVPFIWSHRKDYLIYQHPGQGNVKTEQLLWRDDLWRIYHLAIKYRAMLDRKAHISKLWDKLGVELEYYHELYNGIQSSDEAADLVDYLTLKYQKRLREMAHQAGAELVLDDAEVDAVRSGISGQKYKRATSDSMYAKAKDSLVARFADRMSITAEQLAQGIEAGSKTVEIPEPASMPEQIAEEYTDASGNFPLPNLVINGAKTILINEVAKEPSIRRVVRTMFKNFGGVSVKPTDKGMHKIDDMHPYYQFKYLLSKPVDQLSHRSALFLQILAAENEGLVTVDIHIQRDSLRALTQDFYTAYLSDSQDETSRAWNKIREDVVVEALQNHLLPLGARWTKDWLKESAEDWVCGRAAAKLEQRIDVAPYVPREGKKGDLPRVMAISAGRGEPNRDAVNLVVLNARGVFVAREALQEIRFATGKEELAEHIKQYKPDVIVVGGFTPATYRMKEHVELTLMSLLPEDEFAEVDPALRAISEIPVVWCHDDVARLYQHSKRAAAEFGALSTIQRYCLGLARYVQDPLCEHAALGDDLIALSLDPNQRLVPKEKLMRSLQAALVNFVNVVGVDINRALREEAYYGLLLPYVAGLGPRKASGMVRRIKRVSEQTLVCRADLVKKNVCTSRIFMNCVAFLKIPREGFEEEDEYDILDSTRIHSEDYHIARKMAADAEEMDEEDTEDLAHPSGAVVQLIENGPEKLDDLSLDDFAAALQETQGLLKRTTLYNIRRELQAPYQEQRAGFEQPLPSEVFTMISGESQATLAPGLKIPVVILRIINHGDEIKRIISRTDSGFEAESGPGKFDHNAQYRVGQMLQAEVHGIEMQKLLEPPLAPGEKIDFDNYVPLLSVSLAQEDIMRNNGAMLKYKPDACYDHTQAELDKAADEARNKRAQGRHRRVIGHPNFHNFNAGQAEQYLANQQRGDCVIRPSSRGTDHLAVTWKVDDGIYQHIDVLELDKQNEFSLGRSLRIQGKYTYTDLDELIFLHVRAMARKVEEMMHSEKYKGSETDLRRWLNTSIMAEPTRSFYGFAIDARKPGNFILSFLTKGYDIQSWSVTVEPDQFILQGNSDPAPNVTMLCNAFKSTYITKMALAGGQAAGLAARTPYIGGRTPAAYQTGMTPYSARSPYVASGQHQQQMPPRPPGGAQMHPSRMAQLQAGGAYGR